LTTLVTGAGGFLGRTLVEHLLERGQEVLAVDRQIPAQAPARADWRQGDISRPDFAASLLAGERIRWVAHLAYVLPPDSENAPDRAVATNCAGSAVVFEAARKAAVERVVWTSSMAVYGPASRYSGRLVDESAEVHPATLYGATKVLVERLADSYRALGLSVVGLRFNLVFGPGRVRGLGPFVAWGRDMIESSALDRLFRVPYADHEADWIYVKDAARAIHLALEAQAPAGIYNVLGERATARRVAEILTRLVPSCRLELEAGDLGESARTPAFVGAAARDLGFRPAFDLEAALADYLAAVRGRQAQAGDRVG
jgi:nucleoside-diphosphate-sugar epimerase